MELVMSLIVGIVGLWLIFAGLVMLGAALAGAYLEVVRTAKALWYAVRCMGQNARKRLQRALP